MTHAETATLCDEGLNHTRLSPNVCYRIAAASVRRVRSALTRKTWRKSGCERRACAEPACVNENKVLTTPKKVTLQSNISKYIHAFYENNCWKKSKLCSYACPTTVNNALASASFRLAHWLCLQSPASIQCSVCLSRVQSQSHPEKDPMGPFLHPFGAQGRVRQSQDNQCESSEFRGCTHV